MRRLSNSVVLLRREKWLPSNVTAEGLIRSRSEKVKKDCTVGLNDVTRSILKKYGGKLPIQNSVAANKNIKKTLAKIGVNKIIVNRTLSKGTKNIGMISKGRSIGHLSTMVGD